MNHLRKFFSYDYQFQIYDLMARSDKYYFLIGIIALVLAILLKFAAASAGSPVDKGYRNRFFNIFLTLGLWEVAWFGLRYESVRFFGSHFVAFVGLLVCGLWLLSAAWKMFRHYSADRQQWEKDQVKLKYLPK